MSGTFRVLSAMMVVSVLSSLIFKPVLKTKKAGKSLLNLDNWRNPRFILLYLKLYPLVWFNRLS